MIGSKAKLYQESDRFVFGRNSDEDSSYQSSPLLDSGGMPANLHNNARDGLSGSQDGGSGTINNWMMSNGRRSHGSANAREWNKILQPHRKAVINFPERIDKAFQPMDDAVIRLLQFRIKAPMRQISLILTAMASIELGIALPFYLFVLGYDEVATHLTFFMFFLAITTQVPKRFMFRCRPYLIGRAKQVVADKTSAFPSRAVTCATVYGAGACYLFHNVSNYLPEDDPTDVPWWLVLLACIYIIFVSMARINLGVHYFSDCIAGFFFGGFIVALSIALGQLSDTGCQSCYNDQCYAHNFDELHTWQSVRLETVLGPLVTLLCFEGLVVLLSLKEVDFWRKIDHVFGMLLACLAFRYIFICPRLWRKGKSLAPPPRVAPWESHVYGVAVALSLTVTMVLCRGRWPAITFPLCFFVSLGSLILWRLWAVPGDVDNI